jgi:hypothetical protein
MPVAEPQKIYKQMKKVITLLPVLLLMTVLHAQSLQQSVNLRYSSEPLGAVLADISAEYNVRFSYSPDFIPVDKTVSISADNVPLSFALDDICEQVPMKYASAGGQILLKPDRSKEARQIGQLSTRNGKIRQTSPIYPEPYDKAERERLRGKMSSIERSEEQLLIEGGSGNDLKEMNTASYRVASSAEMTDESYIWSEDRRLAQISLLPFLSSNSTDSEEITNHVSFNVLWGTNGGVEGLEIGGLVNTVRKDVDGMQIAGLGNSVGGNVEGTQVGGLFNVNGGQTTGLQIAGLVNVTNAGHAIQLAGLGNKVRNDYKGLQVGGLFNHSGGKAEGSQLAGLFNYSYDTAGTQLSGLFNVAGDVNTGQLSALFNKGRKVNGFQLGLINVSDTISGTPVGLLNIVKKGYNRIEVSANDVLYANIGLKLGAHKFYNIFHVGARWDDLKPGVQGETPGTYMSWGVGYGIGHTTRLGRKWLLNTEVVAIQINEQEYWTNTLNLLNQLRLTLDVHPGKNRLSYFVGPVANLMVSQVENPETGELGSTVIRPSHLLIDNQKNDTSVKAWIGIQAGIRF